MRKVALLLILALALPCMSGNTIVVRRGGAPAWQTPVTDDFNRADGANLNSTSWTEVVGNPALVSTDYVSNNGTDYVALWDDDTFAAKQCNCAQIIFKNFCGVALRFDSLSSTTNGYVVRAEEYQTPVRWCADAVCTTIEIWSNMLHTGDWLCACVDGENSATEFALWDLGASDPSGQDPTDWGDADVCVCDDTTCSLWDCTATQAWDTTPSYRNCGGDACYMGLYSGSTNYCELDDISMRDYK